MYLNLFLMALSVATCCARKNVLFIVADDLRPELNAYYESGSQLHPGMHTPNIDALAGKSLVLKKAHVQLPLCGPSRTSFMTGRRPDTTRVHGLTTYWRDVAGDFETIPEHFKLNGYKTAGMGKIFHGGEASGDDDDAQSWTEAYFHGNANHESSKKSVKGISKKKLKKKPLIDEQIADQAITTLQNLAAGAHTGEDPFFIAVGFKKPHLPFVFPKSVMKKYYPSSDIDLPSNPYAPGDMPEDAWKSWGELRGYKDITKLNVDGSINATLPDKNVLALRRGYYSAVTWMDEQVGRVLDELEDLGLANDTIVSFIGDHGFLLGEHGGWCKQSQFELATHAPMMIHIPGLTDAGVVTEQLAEFVDLFPTITTAAGLEPLDLCPENSTLILNCTEGISLLPLVSNPSTAIRNAAFSQSPRQKLMGYTIRTHEFRYTEWVKYDYDTYVPDWSKVSGVELYDLTTDPEENYNVAAKSNYDGHVTVVKAALHSGWRNSIL